MDEGPGGRAHRNWYWRKPLVDQWAETGERFRDRVLAFWIRVSERDDWTFDQLKDLLRHMLDSGEEVPAALNQWALEVAAERRQKKVGRKSDPNGDFRTLMGVEFAKELFGWSARRAYREIAELPWPQRSLDGKRTGKVVHRSWETVASAARRARSLPK